MKKAVLLVFFNRLDNLKKVFEQVRIAQPPRLYLASDGPRDNKVGEKEKVEGIRKWVLDHVDWKCDVKTRFLDKNSGGCAYGVSGAVTWFFENEKDGIILEDDCVPSQSFFPYCEELLDKYKDNKKVWHITGYGYYQDPKATETYYFSKIQHCWGWASWADRWKYFSLDLSGWDDENIKKFSRNKAVQKKMKGILKVLRESNPKETWAWPWSFWIVANDGYCINPYKNMITNVGLEGEHYKGKDDGSNSLNTASFDIDKIVHPKEIQYNMKAINYIYRYHYGIQFSKLFGWETKNKADYRQKMFKVFGLPIIKIKKNEIKKKTYVLGIRIKLKKRK
ncbi:MAG: hypothetical protein E7021_02200 [Alphaproteobacteria bacterium]|nr:hypothetical protein [Alphaproteobacteria bacterium]